MHKTLLAIFAQIEAICNQTTNDDISAAININCAKWLYCHRHIS